MLESVVEKLYAGSSRAAAQLDEFRIMTLQLERAEKELNDRRHEMLKFEETFGSENKYLRGLINEQEKALLNAQQAHTEATLGHYQLVEQLKAELEDTHVKKIETKNEYAAREADMRKRLREAWLAEETMRAEREEILEQLQVAKDSSIKTPEKYDTKDVSTSYSPSPTATDFGLAEMIEDFNDSESAHNDDKSILPQANNFESEVSFALRQFHESLDQFTTLNETLTTYHNEKLSNAERRDKEESAMQEKLMEKTQALQRALETTSAPPSLQDGGQTHLSRDCNIQNVTDWLPATTIASMVRGEDSLTDEEINYCPEGVQNDRYNGSKPCGSSTNTTTKMEALVSILTVLIAIWASFLIWRFSIKFGSTFQFNV